jgi:hypothetical protein
MHSAYAPRRSRFPRETRSAPQSHRHRQLAFLAPAARSTTVRRPNRWPVMSVRGVVPCDTRSWPFSSGVPHARFSGHRLSVRRPFRWRHCSCGSLGRSNVVSITSCTRKFACLAPHWSVTRWYPAVSHLDNRRPVCAFLTQPSLLTSYPRANGIVRHTRLASGGSRSRLGPRLLRLVTFEPCPSPLSRSASPCAPPPSRPSRAPRHG